MDLVDGEAYKTYEIDYGTAITPEKEPTKEGHNFTGWSDIPETMPANDVTVTGSFTKGEYKQIVVPEATEMEGYTFDGWADVPENYASARHHHLWQLHLRHCICSH